MSRTRIEGRTGPVDDWGRAILVGYRHWFGHRGQDLSGKGTIEPCNRGLVHGVLYQLSDGQLKILAGYERGYRQFSIVVKCAARNLGHRADVFQSISTQHGLCPNIEYLGHYRVGMVEHEIPGEYRRFIEGQASGFDDRDRKPDIA